MAIFKIWQDHVTQFYNRYREIQNRDGTITHEAIEGEVIHEGTPQNAKNFNDLEERVLTSKEVAAIAILKIKVAESNIKDLQKKMQETTNDRKEKNIANTQSTAIALLKVKIAESNIKELQKKATKAEETEQNLQKEIEKTNHDRKEKDIANKQSTAIALLKVKMAENQIKELQKEVVKTTLTNTKEYPFNNSKTTIALKKPRRDLNYDITTETIVNGAGSIGEIRITDKQVNGFKIEYTGTATSVSVKCMIQGSVM